MERAPLTVVGREAASSPYRLRPYLLSRAEARFFASLRLGVGTRYLIWPKVRLLDLCESIDVREHIAAFNHVASRHVDFILCDGRAYRPVLGIELDDASHRLPDRIVRDIKVDSFFTTIGLPLLRLPAVFSYTPQDVVDLIDTAIATRPPRVMRPAPPPPGVRLAAP